MNLDEITLEGSRFFLNYESMIIDLQQSWKIQNKIT